MLLNSRVIVSYTLICLGLATARGGVLQYATIYVALLFQASQHQGTIRESSRTKFDSAQWGLQGTCKLRTAAKKDVTGTAQA